MLGLFTVVAVLLAFDAVWLTMNASYHRSVFALLQGQPLKIRWIPAVLVYILIAVAVYFFAVSPSTQWIEAAGRGAAIGASMYGVYDLTNYATITNYPVVYAVSDIMWGTFLCASAAAIAKVTETRSFGM